ncbi:MAG TPA: hypothetical protein VGD96_00670, partial [Bradyrhizobium sp.]
MADGQRNPTARLNAAHFTCEASLLCCKNVAEEFRCVERCTRASSRDVFVLAVQAGDETAQ